MKGLIGSICCLLLVGSALAANASPMTSKQMNAAKYCPPQWCEKEACTWTGCGWEALEMGCPTSKARVWMQDCNTCDSCNKKEWRMDLQTQVDVAQWMIWNCSGDGWYWGVRKPGIYCSEDCGLSFRSNYDVELSFSGFDQIASRTRCPGMCDTVYVHYALMDMDACPPPVGDPAWMTPAQLNGQGIMLYASPEMACEGWCGELAACIEVGCCNPCGEYMDCGGAEIVATLQCCKPWIDPETGYFSGMPEFPL